MKYRVSYKASDEPTIYQLAIRIKEFYRERTKKVRRADLAGAWSTDEQYFVLTWSDGERETNFTISLDMKNKWVSKRYSANTFLTSMDKDELKFFDMLGFELEPKYADAVHQDITDWFGM